MVNSKLKVNRKLNSNFSMKTITPVVLGVINLSKA